MISKVAGNSPEEMLNGSLTSVLKNCSWFLDTWKFYLNLNATGASLAPWLSWWTCAIWFRTQQPGFEFNPQPFTVCLPSSFLPSFLSTPHCFTIKIKAIMLAIKINPKCHAFRYFGSPKLSVHAVLQPYPQAGLHHFRRWSYGRGALRREVWRSLSSPASTSLLISSELKL